MMKEQALLIDELCIDVDANTEDAFFFLSYAENVTMYAESNDSFCDAAQHAGDRLAKLPYKERMEAIGKAYKMIENQKKYGVPCAAWCS